MNIPSTPPQRSTARRPSLTVLDPRTLGRPVHLLGRFCERLRQDLQEVFLDGLNRRYRAAFQITSARMLPCKSAGRPDGAAAPRWQGFACEVGHVGFSLDRDVLLSVLHHRYGLGEIGEGQGLDSAQLPETASEGRLAAMLGLQLVNTLAARIDSAEGAVPAVQAPAEFVSVPALQPTRESWVIEIGLRETAHKAEGVMRFVLDEAWMARLLQKLAPGRDRGRDPAPALPLAPRLPLTLVARLVERPLTLGELMDLHEGDVIPVSLGLADVLVDGAPLMRAAVAEHKGKLCLTSFEDTE